MAVEPHARGMVGRDHLRSRLLDVLGAAAGPGRLLWVEGEAGIGKTRLLSEADTIARDFGLGVLRGIGWSDPATPAYWVWTQVLRQALPPGGAATAAELVAARWGERGRAAAALLPELADGAALGPTERASNRFPIFDAVHAALRAEARERPLLVLLDDVHWADPDSLQLLTFLASSGLPDGVVVLAAWRVHETGPADPAHEARLTLHRWAEVFTLTGLAAEDVARLVAETSGLRLAPDEVRELTERTGGNPLFASEAGRLAAARGEGGAAVRLLPDSARALLRRRLARLSQPCAATLAAAAVAGASPTLRTVAAVSGQPLDAVVDHLEEAAGAGLAWPEDGAVTFGHALVREALVETVSGPQRRALHAAAADHLSDRVDLSPAALAEAAHHALAALPLGDPDRAVDWGSRAAAAVFDARAYAAAAQHWLRVADVVAADDPRRSNVLLGWAEALLADGDLDRAREVFEEAAALARKRVDADALAAAALGFAAGLAGFEVRLHDQAQVALLTEALDALPDTDSVSRVDLLARLSVAVSYTADDAARKGLTEQAVAMARRLGDPRATAHALAAHCDAVAGVAHVRLRIAEASEIIALSEGRDPASVLLGLRLRVVALLEVGDAAGAFADMDHFTSLASELGQPLYLWYVPLWEGLRAQLRGDVPTMLACAAEARAVGGRVGSRNAAVLSHVQELWAAGEENRLAEQLPKMLSVLGILPELSPDGTSSLALFPGQPDHVRRAALPRLTTILDELPDDAEMVSGLCHLAVALTDGGDEPEYCDLLYPRLAPYAGLVAVDGIAAGTHGVVDRLLGLLAFAAGHLDLAEQHARDALAGNTHFGSRLHTAHSEAVLAAVLERLGGPSRAEEARRLYAHAQAELLAMGLRARAEFYAERYPVSVEPSVPEPSVAAEATLVRGTDFWTLTYQGRSVTLADSKGLTDLAVLLSRPGSEVHVLDLDGGGRADTRVTVAADGDLGEVVDAQARRAYAERLAQLDDDIADAEDGGRTDTAERLRDEREALLSALRSAYGLGGRARRTGGAAERARSRITRRIRDTVGRVEQQHPEAGRHLRASVHTGVFCRYEPELPVRWHVTT